MNTDTPVKMQPISLATRIEQVLCIHNYCLTGFVETKINGRQVAKDARLTCIKCNHIKLIPRNI